MNYNINDYNWLCTSVPEKIVLQRDYEVSTHPSDPECNNPDID
jgi:hypothetical protein